MARLALLTVPESVHAWMLDWTPHADGAAAAEGCVMAAAVAALQSARSAAAVAAGVFAAGLLPQLLVWVVCLRVCQ